MNDERRLGGVSAVASPAFGVIPTAGSRLQHKLKVGKE